MKYRNDRYGKPMPVLGYGCMRFTQKNGKIDIPKAQEEVRRAFEGGITYYDTAYTYPGNEAAVGEILEDLGIRDRVNIATKFPHYRLKKTEDIETFFREELRRLRTDHVDYYLMHMLNDVRAWKRISALGIQEWIRAKKESGEIREIGFSYHGNSDMFKQVVDAFDWDFCQIQYNYMDEYSQAGVEGLKYAHEKGLPVIIMEPLRGRWLANKLPDEARKRIDAFPVKRSPADWSFRWLWNQPEVTCVLSGMNSLEMLEENLRIAEEAEAGVMTEEEMALIGGLRDDINSKMKVGCTGCRYCMPCPHNVDIPGTFSAYNRRYSEGAYVALKEYFMCTVLRKDPTSLVNCIGCGLCETKCPQHIEIRTELKNAGKVLENVFVKAGRKIVPLFMKY
ncbi:MAG: aldo/keto reductase [Lachnospiraceae bacterium]|nr:aldo/keto reductase [Lachnospiraceae bacterium]